MTVLDREFWLGAFRMMAETASEELARLPDRTARERPLGRGEGGDETVAVDRVVEDGDVVEAAGLRFDIIHAPGHTNGCVIYQLILAGRIIWFVGDVLMCQNRGFSPDLGWEGGEEFDKSTYIETLKRLSAMQVDCILAGHYAPYLVEGKKLVGRAYVKALIEWR